MPLKRTSLLTKEVDTGQLHGEQLQGDLTLPYQQKKTGTTVLGDVVSLAENIEVNEAADDDEAIIKLGGSG